MKGSNDITSNNVNDDFQEYCKQIKEDIIKLINDNKFIKASRIIEQYNSIVDKDIEMYSFESIIAIKENKLDKAEEIIKKGLEIDNCYFDLVYNLAFVYELKKEFDKAVKFYKLSLVNSQDIDLKNEIEIKIKSIEENTNYENFNSNLTSIVILTYNNLEYTKLCIDSIRNYTEKQTYEIIVVDNNSTDGTIEWLKEQNDIRTIFNNENLGFPKGCNQGINIADKSSDILLLNNDVIVTPNWLANLRKCLYSQEDIGAVGAVSNNCSYYQSMPVNYKNINEMISYAKTYNISDCKMWEQRVKLVGFCMLIRRNTLNTVGFLDERFSPGNFEDDDLSFRIQMAGYKLLLCKDVFIHHFGSSSFKEDIQGFNNLLSTNSKKFEEKWGFNSSYSTFIRNEIIEKIKEPKEKAINVLEVGCACGATILKIKDLYPNANIYGIELNQNSGKIASNFADVRSENIENINLSYKENSFDYIIFADVLEHLFNPEQVLKNMGRYLKNDGHVLLSIPNVMHYSVIKDLLNGNWSYEDAGILDRTHIRFFTLNEINKMFVKTGYAALECSATTIPLNKNDEVFLDKLNNLMDNNLKQQFQAYQYIIKAKKLNNSPIDTNVLKKSENRESSCYIDKTCDIRGIDRMHFGNNVVIQKDCWLNIASNNIKYKFMIEIGDNSNIGRRSTISAANKIIIGKNVLLGPNVLITDHNHEYKDIMIPIMDQGIDSYDNCVNIGNNSWIGTNSVIVGNVQIGKNCVIAANSVVNMDIPDYCVAAGSPAKIVKTFDLETGKWIVVLTPGKLPKK